MNLIAKYARDVSNKLLFADDLVLMSESMENLVEKLLKWKRQWLFCRQQHFTLRDYFAVSYLLLVNLNGVLNM